MDTSSFGNAAYQKRKVIVFDPADVIFEEINKAMHLSLDYRETNVSTTQASGHACKWTQMDAVNVK